MVSALLPRTYKVEVLAPLAKLGIPVQNWSTEVISSVPLSSPDFIKTILILSPHKDIGMLREVFVIGLRKNQYTMHGGILMIVHHAWRDFEEKVKQQHAIPFLGQKVVRDALCNFLKHKLDETIDQATGLEEVCAFSKHLKIMKGEIVEQETSGKPGSATVVHRNRKS
ncbi:hypothetical protein FRX31_032629 [Thalictrum thalictroides]|uniref:Uncharacterized protein n=1 Tax=Thalictrum thalictroides TaxID=46969 RepID=A0A7J6UYT4_THATH|nr:hypothetical protein FRX31_032629 [Thalictrum thalictroides]